VAGWLTRAAAAFGPKRAVEPAPFAVPCDCGAQLSGFRTAAHQKLRCLGCDRPILVLPANPYPAVKRKTASPLPKPVKTAVLHDDEAASATRTDRKSRKKQRRKRPDEQPASNATAPKTESVANSETEARIDLSPVLAQARSRRRTLRLVVVAITALVAVTGWSLHRRSLREQARLRIPEATESGLAALHRGDFATAEEQFAIAVQSLNTLRRNDVAAEAIRQSWREAVAARNLASLNLAELAQQFLLNAGSGQERGPPLSLASDSKWLVFDVGLVAIGDSGFEMEAPWALDDRTVQVVCDFPQLRQLISEPSPDGSRRAVFAGQIESWQAPANPNRPLVARLNGTTAFLWTDYDSYRAIGYESDSPEDEQETRDLLNRQREIGTR
jgi:hypothetical protein